MRAEALSPSSKAGRNTAAPGTERLVLLKHSARAGAAGENTHMSKSQSTWGVKDWRAGPLKNEGQQLKSF